MFPLSAQNDCLYKEVRGGGFTVNAWQKAPAVLLLSKVKMHEQVFGIEIETGNWNWKL